MLIPARTQVMEAIRQEAALEARKALNESPPSIINTQSAAALLDRREFVFRGRRYCVPPVPWELALPLLDARQKLSTVGRSGVEDTVTLLHEIVALARQAARPVNPIGRAVWRFTRNPFRRATPREVGELLGFFSMCAMTPDARQEMFLAGSGTSPMTLPASLPATPPGAPHEATRFHGATS